ncbi:glycosyltransferase [Euzebya sp.]|uniref:glycosyltransferase n=1 Tax=Euzebya sp. TaxID=1971409 RepID=UPI003516908A
MRIVQVANFVSPTSGGIRTTLAHLRQGYATAGHEPVLVVPGARDGAHRSDGATVVTVRAPRIPRSGGYRMIVDLGRVRRLLDDLDPDRVEVSDRFTLRAVGDWAAVRRVPSMVVVHERLDRLASVHLPWILRPAVLARRDNAAVAARFDTVVSPSRWAAEEFTAAGVHDVHVVRWGVDADVFRPDRRSAVLRRRLLGGESVLVVMVCRLSPEKQPGNALAALAALRRRGIDARLVVAGTGQAERGLRRRARDLPVTFLGHLRGREHVAELLASADVAICPGPIETFGLAALESLASGTPVVAAASGAVAELLDEPYGAAAHGYGPAMAAAAVRLLDGGTDARRQARAAAEGHGWDRATQHMLHLHGLADAPHGINPVAPPRP